MKKLLPVLMLCFSIVAHSQSDKSDIVLDVQILDAPFKNLRTKGIDISIRYYLTNNFSLGGGFQFTTQKFPGGMGYDTERTLLHHFNFQVIPQYDIFKNQNLIIGLQLRNGVSSSLLYDRDDLIESPDAEWSLLGNNKTPNLLDTDVYYLLTPQLNISYKIVPLDEVTDIYVTLNGGYQMAFGRGHYTRPADFRNYIVSLGILIKGPTE